MDPRSRIIRVRATAALGCILAICLVEGCSGGSRAKPVATLASSPQAATAFEAIRDAWNDPDHTPTEALRTRVESFLVQFPSDGLTPLARITLALVAMKQSDLATADRELALTAQVPRGTVHDLWTIARARRLRLGGDPEAALTLLRPLVGKNVDPLARSVFQEELTVTAVATDRDYEAITYMDAWLRASSSEEKSETVERVSAIVAELPKDVLVGALEAMRSQRATLGYGAEIQQILAERLVRIATTSGDAELARTVIEADPEAFAAAGDAGTALGELATSRRGLNVVEGRTLGVLLPTGSPDLRDESADVLRGVMWALGLPRGSRGSSQTEKARSGVGSAPKGRTPNESTAATSCAPLEPAPELPEPSDDEATRLVTRDDSGNVDRTEVSLEELAGEGSAIIVAGLDEKTSDRALRWGQEHHVPVIALVPPAEQEADGTHPFDFVLGEQRTTIIRALVGADPTIGTEAVAPVVDSSELRSFPVKGGQFDGLTFGPPTSCDARALHAGEPRFPVLSWEAEKVHAWLASGSPECAADVVTELAPTRARGVVALTLEAARLLRAPPGIRVLTAQAGIVPIGDPRDPRAEAVRDFAAAFGRVSWWTALGRDAALLARAALLQLPTDSVSDPTAVTDRRSTARDHLAIARARLWTTEASGWTREQTMKRTVCVIDGSAH